MALGVVAGLQPELVNSAESRCLLVPRKPTCLLPCPTWPSEAELNLKAAQKDNLKRGAVEVWGKVFLPV